MNDAFIIGKSGTKYEFIFYPHSANFEGEAPAVYIIVKRIKDSRVNPADKYYQATNVFGIYEKGTPRLQHTEQSVGFLYKACENAAEVKQIKDDLDEPGNLVIKDVFPE